MQIKSILSISLIAVLVIGVISFEDAFAKKTAEPLEVGDQLKLQGKGKGTCTSGEDSGNAKAKIRFLLLVQESEDGDYNGVAKSDFKGIKANCDGLPKALVNDGPLIFSYDAGNEELTVSGDMKAKDGSVFTIEGSGFGKIVKNEKSIVEINLELVGQNGAITVVVNLSGSPDLSGVILSDAFLGSVDLTNADLSGAYI